jgi:hypothetical protein
LPAPSLRQAPNVSRFHSRRELLANAAIAASPVPCGCLFAGTCYFAPNIWSLKPLGGPQSSLWAHWHGQGRAGGRPYKSSAASGERVMSNSPVATARCDVHARAEHDGTDKLEGLGERTTNHEDLDIYITNGDESAMPSARDRSSAFLDVLLFPLLGRHRLVANGVPRTDLDLVENMPRCLPIETSGPCLSCISRANRSRSAKPRQPRGGPRAAASRCL